MLKKKIPGLRCCQNATDQTFPNSDVILVKLTPDKMLLRNLVSYTHTYKRLQDAAPLLCSWNGTVRPNTPKTEEDKDWSLTALPRGPLGLQVSTPSRSTSISPLWLHYSSICTLFLSLSFLYRHRLDSLLNHWASSGWKAMHACSCKQRPHKAGDYGLHPATHGLSLWCVFNRTKLTSSTKHGILTMRGVLSSL